MTASAPEKDFFRYGAEQTGWLASRDPALGAFMAQRGEIRRKIHPDAFTGIVHAIIGQQISTRAQASIWKRFTDRFAPFGHGLLAGATHEELRNCGVSGRKAQYISAIAEKFENGELSHAMLEGLTDSELEKTLAAQPGIGKWTAEMLLIFTFQRQNILSFGDLAIRRGMRNLYGHVNVTRDIFDYHFAIYSPWATVASLYLWEAAARPPVLA